jgi:hypothetical protein
MPLVHLFSCFSKKRILIFPLTREYSVFTGLNISVYFDGRLYTYRVSACSNGFIPDVFTNYKVEIVGCHSATLHGHGSLARRGQKNLRMALILFRTVARQVVIGFWSVARLIYRCIYPPPEVFLKFRNFPNSTKQPGFTYRFY